MRVIHIDKITQPQALTWLLENDPEGKGVWGNAPHCSDFVKDVATNLSDFGFEHQRTFHVYLDEHEELVEELVEEGKAEVLECLSD